MKKQINVLRMGGLAEQALQFSKAGKVMGITSQGVFLNMDRKILFITAATYKSPYNLQVNEISELSKALTLGDDCSSEGKHIYFSSADAFMNMSSAEIWIPSVPAPENNPWDTQKMRIDNIIRAFYDAQPQKGWLFLHSPQTHRDALEFDRITTSTTNFCTAFKNSNLEDCLKAARSISGLGGGLTPSGDDWFTGFILFHTRRSMAQNVENPFLHDLGVSLLRMAQDTTTMISINRIEAACAGWAEEIFLDLVDHIHNEEIVFSTSKSEGLLNFGHSSGVDTALGIQAAVHSLT